MNMNHVMALLLISDVTAHARIRTESKVLVNQLSKCICGSSHVHMILDCCIVSTVQCFSSVVCGGSVKSRLLSAMTA